MELSYTEEGTDMVSVRFNNPNSDGDSQERIFKISNGCSCMFKVTHDFPCSHEICANGLALPEDKINPRWFNQHAYDIRFPDWKTGCNDWRTSNVEQGDTESFIDTDDASSVRTNGSTSSFAKLNTEIEIEQNPPHSTSISFQGLKDQFELIARFAQNSPSLMLEI